MTSAQEWEPGDPVYQRPVVDVEIAACETIVAAFGALDDAARARVLRWAHARYVVDPRGPASPDEHRS
jgi:hypothetical protein